MIGKILCSGLATVAAILLLAGGENAQAQPAAQHSKVVIQVSDGDQAKWNLALNNARNIQADLGEARADGELKELVPEDAKEAFGHGVRAKRSKSGAVSFEVMAAASALTTGGHLALLQ